MPAANPERPTEFTPKQWETACAQARANYGDESWDTGMSEDGKKNPDGWRWGQCYGVALDMYPRRRPAGNAVSAARALHRGEKGNPAGGRNRKAPKGPKGRKGRKERKHTVRKY